MVDFSLGQAVKHESSDKIVSCMASAMQRLNDSALRRGMVPLCRKKVRDCAVWPERGQVYHDWLRRAKNGTKVTTRPK